MDNALFTTVECEAYYVKFYWKVCKYLVILLNLISDKIENKFEYLIEIT